MFRLAFKDLNRWKFATITLVLVVALLVSCFVVLYQPSFEASAKEPVLLNVSIDGPAKIGANAPTDYTARVFGGEGKLTYSWSIGPDDSNVQLEPDGSVCILTFTTATEAPYTLEVTVHDAVGNFGVASMAVYDPPTYPNYYLGVSTAPYSYMIKTDGTGWYYAVNGSDGSVSWSSTNASYIVNTAMADLLTNEQGGRITIIGFMAFTLDYVANNTVLDCVGEVDITTSNNGITVFESREGSEVYHAFIKHENNSYPIFYEQWTASKAFFNQWTDFPSNGGIPTGTPGMLWDGTINTEGAGGIYAPIFVTSGTPYALLMSASGQFDVKNVGNDLYETTRWVASATGAVNEVTVNYVNGRVLDGVPTVILVTSQQAPNVDGGCYAKGWTDHSITIGFGIFENGTTVQPGASTWYYSYEVWVK